MHFVGSHRCQNRWPLEWGPLRGEGLPRMCRTQWCNTTCEARDSSHPSGAPCRSLAGARGRRRFVCVFDSIARCIARGAHPCDLSVMRVCAQGERVCKGWLLFQQLSPCYTPSCVTRACEMHQDALLPAITRWRQRNTCVYVSMTAWA